MAQDKKISELTPLNNPTGNEEIPAAADGNNYKIKIGRLIADGSITPAKLNADLQAEQSIKIPYESMVSGWDGLAALYTKVTNAMDRGINNASIEYNSMFFPCLLLKTANGVYCHAYQVTAGSAGIINVRHIKLEFNATTVSVRTNTTYPLISQDHDITGDEIADGAITLPKIATDVWDEIDARKPGRIVQTNNGIAEIFNYNPELSYIQYGNGSHAEGENTYALGEYSHAEGFESIASGDGSHAEGSYTTAAGGASHAEGKYTIAGGACSHAGGNKTNAINDCETVIGINNEPDQSGKSLFQIGIGTISPNVAKTGFRVDNDGVVWIIDTNTNTLVRLQDLLNNAVGLPTYDHSTYKLTFTTTSGQTLEIDLPIEQMGLSYNAQTQSIEFVGGDGTIQSIPVSQFVQVYLGSVGEHIDISIGSDNVISATLRDGSINLAQLSEEVRGWFTDIENAINFITPLTVDYNLTDTDVPGVYLRLADMLGSTMDSVSLLYNNRLMPAQIRYVTDTQNIEVIGYQVAPDTGATVTLRQVEITLNKTSVISRHVETRSVPDSTSTDVVRTSSQTLTNEQQQQARDNIGALSRSDLDNYYFYGIEWNTTVATSACTRIGNSDLHRSLPIHNRMRGCLLDDDGNVVEYLPSGSWLNSTRDGSMGQVMVEIPDHYRKFETDGTIRRCKMSEYPLPCYHHVPKMYISAYEATVQHSTTTLCSVANSDADYRGGNNNAAWDGTYRSLLGRPVTAISRTNFRNYARKRKSGSTEWNCLDYNAYKAVFWLYYVEYANRNCQLPFNAQKDANGFAQGGLGNGVTTLTDGFSGYNPFIPCGHTDELGNGSGEVVYNVHNEDGSLNKNVYANRYRGIENPFGHIWKWSDGINICISPDTANGGDGTSKVYVASAPANYKDNGYDGYAVQGLEARTNSYVKELVFGEEGDIMPAVVGGGSTTNWADYHYTNLPEAAEALRGVLFGGNAPYGALAGFAFVHSELAPSTTSVDVGSRLCFIPAQAQ